ncbi:MAG: ABC transporter substrate-binding protein [Phycisphaerales bacterium JB040]
MLCIAGCERDAPQPAVRTPSNPAPEQRRLVVLSPALAVMLQQLGHEDDVVARHTWDIALSDSIPTIGDQFELDYEALLRLDPTHVYTQYESAGVPDRLRELSADRGWHLEDYRLNSVDDIAAALDDLYLDLGGTIQTDTPLEVEGVDLGSVPDFDHPLPSDRLATALSDRGPSVRGAGRVLLLASADSPAALGPGSFHHDILVRIGGTPAIEDGGPWMTLDAEDVLRIAPDGIVLFAPREASESDRWPPPTLAQGELDDQAWGAIVDRLGALGDLPIPAIEQRRVLVIDDPLCLLPSPALADVADRMADVLELWSE